MADNITAVSLFTGAGGMDIGFENAGVKVVVANELVKAGKQSLDWKSWWLPEESEEGKSKAAV